MFPQAPSLSGIPSGVLDMTAEFAPFLHGMVIVGLCILGLVFSIGLHDIWQSRYKAAETPVQSASLPKAA